LIKENKINKSGNERAIDIFQKYLELEENIRSLMIGYWPNYRYHHIWASELFFLKGNSLYQMFIKENSKRRPANLDLFYDICDLDLEKLQTYLPKKIKKVDNVSNEEENHLNNDFNDNKKSQNNNGQQKENDKSPQNMGKQAQIKSKDQSRVLSDSGDLGSLNNQSSTTDKQAYYEQYKNKILTEDIYEEANI